MTKDRLESEIESPGYPPVFTLIDDPRDPENAQRLEDAERFRRDNPNGLIIHRLIVRPPRGKSNWANVSREERELYGLFSIRRTEARWFFWLLREATIS
jgi:hypothetical protein